MRVRGMLVSLRTVRRCNHPSDVGWFRSSNPRDWEQVGIPDPKEAASRCGLTKTLLTGHDHANISREGLPSQMKPGLSPDLLGAALALCSTTNRRMLVIHSCKRGLIHI